MKTARDPLVLIYQTLKQAIKEVHGEDFLVFSDFPVEGELRKANRNAACITCISGQAEKALMREQAPHKIRKNTDRSYTAAMETLRLDYLIQVTFFSDREGKAQRLNTEFILCLEEKNELPLAGDVWQEYMQVFLSAPPMPPDGEADLWQCSSDWRCRGRLLTEQPAAEIGEVSFAGKVRNQ